MTVIASTGGGPPAPPDRAAQWFDTPIQSISVSPLGPYSATADGACPVEFDGGASGYVKPRPGNERNLLVAREKIASDLGYLLGFPVAPAVVRSPDPKNQWPHHTLMSLAKWKAARTWGSGGVAHLAAAGNALESLRVFWTWIGDADHNNHGGNVVYSVSSGQCDVLAIDHSYSLCHGNAADSLAVPVCQGYGTTGLPDCGAWTRAAAAKISSLEWATVDKVVRRLQPILAADEQERILRILKERLAHLGTFLGI